MVELCRSRQGMLTMSDQPMKVPTMMEMLTSIRVHRVTIWQVLYGWVLATAGACCLRHGHPGECMCCANVFP